MDCVFSSKNTSFKMNIQMDMFRGVEFIFVKEKKFIRCNLNTFKIMKFLYENSIGTKVKCMQTKDNSLEIQKGSNEYIICYNFPALKAPGILFKLSFIEMEELMTSDVLEKTDSWTTAYWEMSHDTVN